MNFCIMGVSIPIRVSDWVFIILFWLSKNRLILCSAAIPSHIRLQPTFIPSTYPYSSRSRFIYLCLVSVKSMI